MTSRNSLNHSPHLPTGLSLRLLVGLALWLTVALASVANAVPITPTTVKSTSYWTTGDGYHNNTISGLGLSGGGSVLTQTHDNTGNASSMWHGGPNNGGLGGPTGNPPVVSGQKLEFDLGASYSLTKTHVWNHNQSGATGRGVKNFQIWTSPDASSAFTKLGDFVLNQGSGSTGLAAQVLTTAVTNVRRVQFIIQTTWSGLSSDYVGLSEVRFEGSPTPADYTVTTTGNAIVVTDSAGNGDTLAITAPSAGNIKFAAAGRTFSVNGGAGISGDSGTVSLTSVTSITVNAAAGADTINLSAFTGTLPSLTLNGGTGDDTVNFNGDLTFAANANLDVDLQNDDATPGTDLVTVAASANILTSGTGTITVKVSKNVSLASGSSFETVNGNLTIEANQQATPTSGTFSGVQVNNGLVTATGTGVVTVKGKGGAAGAGVYVLGGGDIIGGTTGTTLVQGTGGAVSNSGMAAPVYGLPGIYLSTGGSMIHSNGSDVQLTGLGGGTTTTSSHNLGIYIETSAQVSAGGSGAVTVNGTGGPGDGTTSAGIVLNGTVTSNGGNVQVIGAGGFPGVGRNYGVILSGLISAGGSGTVTVQGSNGGGTHNNFALALGGTITSSGGNIQITGIHVAGDFNTPNIAASGTITTAANGGTITLICNSMALSGTISAGSSGTVTLKPYTSGVAIALGGSDLAAGPLGLLDSELDTITAGTLVLGDSNTGLTTISAVISPANYQTLDIQKALTFSATGGFDSDVTSATVYEMLKANGAVVINTSAALTVSAFGGFVPAASDSFTILDNISASTTTGTFTGKPEGTLVAVGGVNKTLTYVGGTGNDVVLKGNLAPTITSDGSGPTAAFSVAENASAVTTVTASDADTPAQALTYTKSGPDAALFNIGSSSGVLTFISAPNYESPADVGADNVYDVTVTVTDNGAPNLSVAQDISVTITDVNDAPTDIALSGSNIAENEAAASTIGSFSTTDADAGDTSDYSLVTGAGSGDNASFTITDDVLSINISTNFEAKSVYSIRVRSTDGGGLFFEKAFTIIVTDENDAPVITSSETFSAPEKTTAVATLTATDDDAGQTKAFSITGGADATSFSVTSAGVLTFVTRPDYEQPDDFGTDNVYEVTVAVTDDGIPELSDTMELTVTVTDANDAPVITTDGGLATADVSMAENTTEVTIVEATDEDLPPQTVTFSISGGEDAALFRIDGSLGVLTFDAAPNFEGPTDFDGDNIYEVIVTATDNGIGNLTASQAISVTVTDANDAPTAIALSSNFIAEDSEADAEIGTFSATDEDLGQMHTFELVAGVGGTDNDSFTIDNGVLKAAESFDFEAMSSYSIRVQATDDDVPAQSYEQVFTIDIGNVDIGVRDPDDRVLLNGLSAPYGFSDPLLMGTSSTEQTFTIYNPGTAAVSDIEVTMDGSQSSSFILDDSGLETTLEPGETTTFTVTFVPGYFGERRASIHVASSDDTKNPFELSVAGTGTTFLATLTGGALTITDTPSRLDSLNLSVVGTDLVIAAGGATKSNAGSGSGTNKVLIPLSSITGGISVNISAIGSVVTLGNLAGYTGDLTVAPVVDGDFGIRVTGPVVMGTHNINLTASRAITISGALQTTGTGVINVTSTQLIAVNSGAVVSVENGNLTLSSNQALPAATKPSGIDITDASALTSTGTGNVTLRGHSGGASGRGVAIDAASVITGGTSGLVTISGTAADTGANRNGILVTGLGTIITSAGADIALSGVGFGSTTSNHGVIISNGAHVQAPGAANVSITGTGGVAGQGVRIRDDGEATVLAVADGNLSITAHQGFHYLGGETGRIESVGTGTITIVADTIDMPGTSSTRGIIRATNNGALVIKPLTASTSIGLGGGSGTLSLTDAALAYLADGFSSITIGDEVSGSGMVSIDTVSFADSVVLAGGTFHDATGADITLMAGDTVTFKGNVAPGASAGVLSVGGKVSLAANTTLTMEIGGRLVGSQNDQLTASETLDIDSSAQLALVQTGGFIPTGTETFTLITRSDGTGTFAGKPEGFVYSDFFGSGQAATLTYAGGSSGHDVALVMGGNVPDIKVEQPGGTRLTDGIDTINLGKAAVAKRGLTKTFTITNTGTGALTGLALSLSGTDAADFTFSSLVTSLIEGDATTFTVTMTPTVVGVRNAVLHIASNVNGTQNPFEIQLTGTGIAKETTKPLLVISTPGASAKVAEGPVSLTGTISDTVGIAILETKLGSGAWTEITPALNSAGTSGIFSQALSPTPGSNTVSVRVTDTSGNVTTLTRTFTYAVLRPLTLATADSGSGTAAITVPKGANAASLQLATLYTVKATAATGSIFVGWTSPNASVAIANPSNPVLTFPMVEGAQLTAHFVLNPFTTIRTGSYQGLIQAASGTTPAQTNTGLFTASVSSTGTFTGSVMLNGLSKGISGSFHPVTGNATCLAINGATTWSLGLHLDVSALTRRITGTLTQITAAISGDVSDISADRAAFSKTTTVPLAKRGTFNIAFLARSSQTNPAIIYPSGDGIGRVTIDSTGAVKLTGSLADGTLISQSAKLSQDFTWPLYVSFTDRKGSLSGLATVDETAADSDITAPGLTWFLEAAVSTYFPDGWPTGIFTDMTGAKFSVPSGQAVLPGLGATNATTGNADLILSGGLLTSTLTKHLNLTTASVVSKAPTSDTSFKFTLTKAQGTFTGSFTHTNSTHPDYKGTILQKGANAGGYGYFRLSPTTDGTGRIHLQAR